MQGNEIGKIIYILKAGYPQSFAKMTQFDLQNFMDLWSEMLKDYNYSEVAMAVKTYIATDRSHFMPSIGDVIDLIHKCNKKASGANELNENDAWSKVYKAITKANYYAKEEFEMLPAICQMAIGDYNMLKQWAQMPIDKVNSVVASNFMRTFKAIKSQVIEYEKMPTEAKIEQKKDISNLIEVKTIG